MTEADTRFTKEPISETVGELLPDGHDDIATSLAEVFAKIGTD